MKNLFEHTSSPWIRYSSYEYRTAEDGTLYIVVSADAKPEMYNPMKSRYERCRITCTGCCQYRFAGHA